MSVETIANPFGRWSLVPGHFPICPGLGSLHLSCGPSQSTDNQLHLRRYL